MNRVNVNGLTVVADVYDSEQKYRSAFDTIPSYERGYIGINLVFFNDSENAVLVELDNISSITASGMMLETIPATLVAEEVLRNTTGRYLAGGIAGAVASSGANDKLREDFRSKGLDSTTILPGTRTQGFVFFTNDEQIQRLTVRAVSATAGETSFVAEFAIPAIPLYQGG